jgi:hypothetical protein
MVKRESRCWSTWGREPYLYGLSQIWLLHSKTAKTGASAPPSPVVPLGQNKVLTVLFSKGVAGSCVVVPANFWPSSELKDHEVFQNPSVTPNFF